MSIEDEENTVGRHTLSSFSRRSVQWLMGLGCVRLSFVAITRCFQRFSALITRVFVVSHRLARDINDFTIKTPQLG